jgi:hypothetical protein
MYKHLVIDQEHNRLLCNATLVGTGEIVEIFCMDENTERHLCGTTLLKVAEPNEFRNSDGSTRISIIGEKCVLRVLYRNRSGARRRKFSKDEKVIVNMEKGPTFKEIKVKKAKTGSVRKRRRRRSR